MAHRLELSELPNEILIRILRLVLDPDLVRMGRLNRFYRELVMPILKERITQYMANASECVYKSKAYPLKRGVPAVRIDEPFGDFPLDEDIKLLGDSLTIDPDTLELCFVATPLDEQDEFQPLLGAEATDMASLRKIVLPKFHSFQIPVQLYITQVCYSSRRLLQIHPLGTVTLHTDDMYERLSNEQTCSFTDQAQIEHGNAVAITYRVVALEDEDTIVIEFETIRTTPEWWLHRLDNPYAASEDPIQL